ncbi:hypothetical protein G9U52_35850 [Paenibacillus sp. S3N08]|uniref:Transposase n=2 Tax=Paenibacillus agricola TaxID=2716264 RepID=A0ABX0JEY2_9BACL|nr:hypothetical protein [Paenibacillus agricola]
MKQKELSKEASLYQYRLLKRIHYNSIILLVYWGVLAMAVIWNLFQYHPYSLLFALASIPLLHTLLTYLYVTLKEKRSLAHWSFQFRLPWLGLTPTNHIALDRFMKAQMQVLWITIMISGCFYPWLPLDIILNLLIVHVWVFLPRLFLFFCFRKHTKTGYLKLNEKDASCYAQ